MVKPQGGRVYKLYKYSLGVPVPGRTRRRHTRQELDHILSENFPVPSSSSARGESEEFTQTTQGDTDAPSEPHVFSSEVIHDLSAEQVVISDNRDESVSESDSMCSNYEALDSEQNYQQDSSLNSSVWSVPNYSSDDCSRSTTQEIFSINNGIHFSHELQSDSSLSSGRCVGGMPDEVCPDSSDEDLHVNAVEEDDDDMFHPAAYAPKDENVADEWNIHRDVEDEALCDCSATTWQEVIVMVLSLGKRHSLSWVCMEDILKFINVIYRRQVVPASKYYLQKYSKPQTPTEEKYHVYCANKECQNYVESYIHAAVDKEVICSCGERIQSLKKASNFFVTLGMKRQLKDLLETPEVADHVNYRTTRLKINPDSLEDIFDGDRFKAMSQPGQPLANCDNLTYSVNTDGCSAGQTTRNQVWPIYISLNDLPPKLRGKHMLLVGMWVGRHEPNMQVFLKPFVEEANDLAENGVTWTWNGIVKTSKLFILCGIVDSQARWRMLNMTMFGGRYGCTMCEHPTDPSSKGRRYGMATRTVVPTARTDASLRQQMIDAFERRHLPEKERTVCGVKGLSSLILLNNFDLAECFTVDDLHLIKGVAEQHTNILLGSWCAKYYIDAEDDNLQIMTARLLRIRPPQSISRTPRPLADRENWQASEWRSWLVFYGPIVMKGVLKNKYVTHFCMLSCAMHMLLQKSVSREQVKFAGTLILMYLVFYEQYFGIEFMTYNIHQLSHVLKGVLQFGPLWTHNCYIYEGENHYLLQLIKNPATIAKEVMRKYFAFKNLPKLFDEFSISDEVVDYCNSLSGRSVSRFLRSENAVLLGAGHPYQLTEQERVALHDLGIFNTENILMFERMIFMGMKYTTSAYSQRFKRDDSGIYLRDGRKCSVSNIVKVSIHDHTRVFVFAIEIEEHNHPLWTHGAVHLKHIKGIRRKGRLLALHPSHIAGQCLVMEGSTGEMFVTCVPFGCLGD